MKCLLLSCSCWWGPLIGPQLCPPASHVLCSKGSTIIPEPPAQKRSVLPCPLGTSQRLERSAVQGPEAGGPSATNAGSRWSPLTIKPLCTQLQVKTTAGPATVQQGGNIQLVNNNFPEGLGVDGVLLI